MLSLIQSLIIVSLLPIYELNAKISSEISMLSQIDLAILESNETLSPLCEAIQSSNSTLSLLRIDCAANVENPAAVAAITLRGEAIAAEQAIIVDSMNTVFQSKDSKLRGEFYPPTRGAPGLCNLPASLEWQNSTIAVYKSVSGGAINRNSPTCHWQYSDPTVRPL